MDVMLATVVVVLDTRRLQCLKIVGLGWQKRVLIEAGVSPEVLKKVLTAMGTQY